MSLTVEKALIYHAWLGNDREVECILNENIRNSNLLINFKSDQYQGNTAVSSAARNGHLKCLLLLCSYHQITGRYLDLDSLNHQGLAAIHLAALYNHTQCMKLLIDHGCNKFIRSGVGWQVGQTAADLCGQGAGYADPAALAVLQSYDITGSSKLLTYQDEQLINYASNGNYEEVRVLLAQGANINAVSVKKGTTALHAAARNGHIEVIQVLLSNTVRSDVNMYTKGCGYSFNALHLAAANNRKDCVEALLNISRYNSHVDGDRYRDFDKNMRTGQGWNCNLTALEVCGCMSTYGPSRTTLAVLQAHDVAGKLPTHGCCIS